MIELWLQEVDEVSISNKDRVLGHSDEKKLTGHDHKMLTFCLSLLWWMNVNAL